MTKAEAVKVYLKQQREQVPSYLRGVFDLFSGNLEVLMEQNHVSPSVIIKAGFLRGGAKGFKGMMYMFMFHKTITREVHKDLVSRIFENQNLLYNGETVYQDKFSELTEEQIAESCRQAQGWAKGVQAAWQGRCAEASVAAVSAIAGRQGGRKKVQWADQVAEKSAVSQ